MVVWSWPDGDAAPGTGAVANTDLRSGIAAHLTLTRPEAAALAAAPIEPPAAPSAKPLPTAPPWQSEQVRRGDSLARIFQRQGLSPAELQAVIGSGSDARRLTQIHPGRILEYRTDADGALLALRYPLTASELLEVSRPDASAPFAARRVTPEAAAPDPKPAYAASEADAEPAAAKNLTRSAEPAADPTPPVATGIAAFLTFIAPEQVLEQAPVPRATGIAAFIDMRRPDPKPSTSEKPVESPATRVEPDPVPWQSEQVRPGDSLARIFQRRGLRPSELHAILESGSEARRLTRIHPGETLKYRTDDDGRLLAVRYEFSRVEAMEASRIDAGSAFESRLVRRTPDTRVVFKEGRIESSLYLAASRAGLEDATIMNLANVFQWDIDFVHDIRPGDSFHVLFEEQWIDGEKVGNGPIVAAEFVNRGRQHQAVRYTASDGRSDYYAPDGRSMRRAFLRAPVEFSRISSNFNMRRMHPIHNRVVPHRGIDYAAPTGTPVMAAGDGVVTTAASHHANGNYIIIRHGEQYQTKYLHLHRFARGVRSGTRVRQGQVIGYVGMTGWATGPHLHYEFLVNGVHQNPRTVNLPQAEPIADSERERFLAATRDVIASLNEQRSDERIAMSSSSASAGE